MYTCDEGHQIIGIEKVVCQVWNEKLHQNPLIQGVLRKITVGG